RKRRGFGAAARQLPDLPRSGRIRHTRRRRDARIVSARLRQSRGRMVGSLARHETRAAIGHRRPSATHFLAAMESAHDGAGGTAREESSMITIALPSRQEVEDFLYREAALLDEWRLEEWLEMLTDDAIYQVPSTDTPEGDVRN